MLLRPRQKQFVERSVRALDEHGNTLGVAPTGAGKTIMLSGVVSRMVGETPKSTGAKACVLAHRDELTAQNRSKFGRVNSRITTSVVDAKEKSWAGQVTFAMVPTLARSANLDQLPALDLLVIDEAHHAAANSYRRIIDTALQRNPMPDLRSHGDAEPGRQPRSAPGVLERGRSDPDRRAHCVRPSRAAAHLRDRCRRPGPAHQGAPHGRRFRHGRGRRDHEPLAGNGSGHPPWREKAGERQTVVFCSTVDHARNVTAAFNAASVAAGPIHGDMADTDRKTTLDAYAAGELRVVVNVAVLTEGWDHPPTGCVVLLRPSS